MIEFQSLGSIDLRSSDGRAIRSLLAQPKRLALFAYLVLERPGTVHRRDTLVGVFWPELSEARARAALRKSLHYLRTSLGDDAIVGQGEEAVGVAAARVRCDVVNFERALAAGELAPALELYRGDLLAGLFVGDAPEFERWLDARRAALRDRAVRAAWDLAEHEITAGNAVGAAHYGRRACALDSASETALQRLIILLDRLGDRAGALRAAHEFVHRLAAEELTPAPETLALITRVSSRAAAATPVAEASASSLSEAPMAATSSSTPDVPGGITREQEQEPMPRPWLRSRRVRIAGVAAAVVLLASVPAIRALSVDAGETLLERRGLPPNVAVVLADFTSTDAGLARAMTEAVRIDVAHSRVVRLVERERVAEALVRMQRDPLTPIEASVALELARREGFPAVIAGSIEPAGRGYLIAAQLVSATDGQVLASERLTAADSSRLLHAIDQLSKTLRRSIGESARQLRSEPPLEQVTTSNLRALESFSLALRALFAQGDNALAVALLENALELDSTFAAAHTTLGLLLLGRGQRTRAIDALTRGYELRHTLTERERLWLSAHYFRVAAQDLVRAAHAYQSLLELEADRAPASDLHDLHAEYADVLMSLRQDALAEQHARLALTHDLSWRWLGQRSLGRALVYQGAFDAAAASLAQYLERVPSQALAMLLLSDLHAARGDFVAATASLERLRALQPATSSLQTEIVRRLADLAAVRGQVELALKWLSSLPLDGARATPAFQLARSITEARYHIEVAREPERGRAILEAALARAPLAELPPLDRPYAALIEALAAAGVTGQARDLLAQADALVAGAANGFETASLDRARGAVALAERRFADAIAAYRRADAGRCRVCALPGLGRAYDLAGQPDSAIAVYQRFLSTPDIDRLSYDALTLGATYERLAQLHEARGDAARAAKFRERFVALWAEADPALRRRLREPGLR